VGDTYYEVADGQALRLALYLTLAVHWHRSARTRPFVLAPSPVSMSRDSIANFAKLSRKRP
jgi:hypothetical protein